MLAASTLAQAASAIATNGMAFLLPALHGRDHLSLATAGVVVATPTVGVMLTLVAWGWMADHRGERVTLLTGLSLATVFSVLAALLGNLVVFSLLIGLAGGAAAAVNSASGRVVVGWFPPERRGLAMGIRQMAQPVGVGIAAISVAVVADHHGVHAALWVPAIGCGLAALLVAALVVDPPRPARKTGTAPNPYRGDRYLARIHGVSVLLVVPQFVVWTFALVWLEQGRHWEAAAAGALVAVAQVFGALGRIAAGRGWWAAVPLVVIATVLTVADNGLAFTAVAERAGAFWSGRALGLQNTAQFLASSFVPPLGGLAVTHLGYSWTFALAAAFPAVAIGLVPVRGERAVS